jgi:pilus assembly protein FimV
MLRQELQQTKESLAARDAEVQELKSRMAELEKLQADQQKLIAMQNSQLHAAQQRPTPPPAVAPPETHASPMPWVAGGALVVAGLLAAAWNRRRARREPVFRAPPDAPRPSVADAFAAVDVPAPSVVPAPDAPVDVRPSWEKGARRARSAPPKSAPLPPLEESPVASVADADAAAEPTAVERLELAQAYLDLGDANNARRLLGEVMDGGDATARGVAAKMLRDIG